MIPPRMLAATLALAAAAPVRGALAQEPAPAAAAPPAAPAVDSNTLWVGEWDFTAQMNDGQLDGAFQINYGNGRFTGTVVIPNLPPAPISSMSVRDHYRNFQLTVYFNNESYVFSGHLDNPRNVTGTLNTRGGIGRMRAQKRG